LPDLSVTTTSSEMRRLAVDDRLAGPTGGAFCWANPGNKKEKLATKTMADQ
jgi:hypothetical protein